MPKHYRLVGMVPAKNEVRNIERWLKRNGEFFDAIVALDDGSTDGTTELLRSHPKVISLTCRPAGTPWYLLKNRQHLLSEAKKTGAEWLFFLDADDVMDARLGDHLDDLLRAPDVDRYKFREVTLWRSPRHYRIDKPESYHRIDKYPTLFRNKPQVRWVAVDEGFAGIDVKIRRQFAIWFRGRTYKPIRKRRYNGLRVNNTLAGLDGRTVELGEIMALHYHYADWDHAWRKQVRYGLNYAIAWDYKPQEIDDLFITITSKMDETGLRLAPVKPEWGVLD